jgi:hypothetical protein
VTVKRAMDEEKNPNCILKTIGPTNRKFGFLTRSLDGLVFIGLTDWLDYKRFSKQGLLYKSYNKPSLYLTWRVHNKVCSGRRKVFDLVVWNQTLLLETVVWNQTL